MGGTEPGAPPDSVSLMQRYRQAGWWPGERLADRFEKLVTQAPDALCVTDDRGNELTRSQLWAESGRIADELAEHGITAGDVVLIALPNRAEWQTIFLACLRLRAVPATIPVTTGTDTFGYVCTLVGARAIAAPVAHRSQAVADEAIEAARSSGRAVEVVRVAADGTREWVSAAGERAVQPEAPPDLAQLMFTSSTTGRPKAVMHTEDTLAAVNLGFAHRFSLTGRPIFMPAPLGHSVGAWHGARLSLFTGSPLVLQDQWDPERAIATIEATDSEFTVAATPLLKDLLDVRRPAGMRGLGTLLSGGAPVPSALLEQAMEQLPGTLVSVLWGMSEGGVTTCRPGEQRDRILGTDGVGLPGLELRTIDVDGAPTGPGETGELVMRGPGVFTGYFGQHGLYRQQLTEGGFFRTGDLAALDEDGYLRLTGRVKDLIIRGGINISPAPLEEQLAAHPRIQSVAVVGYPDERMGERICAVVVPQGQAPELSGLVEWLRQRNMPRRLWPERLCVVDEMPRTAVGKIRKLELRDRITKELV